MPNPTAKSGHRVAVAATSTAATNTAMLWMASLRVHSHTDRMFESPWRYRYSINATQTFTTRAMIATTPMVVASGIAG